MAEDLVGRTLGRYRITAFVGRGGMATVYKAQHPGLEQTVAIKVLHPHIATDPDLLRRFRQEAQAVANLRHPNIVRVVDFDYIGDAYFMVMEYIDGPTLAAYLAGLARQGRRLPVADTVSVFAALGSAVDYAHSQGMIHRDIKPSNILLTSQGEPVLTDYGIAKIVGVTQHTATGTVMGSAYYMSPEQAQGASVDGRSDLYSLGVILFEVLTGRVPYEGDTLATVLVKHITSPVPAVRAFNAALPPSLDDTIRVALAKDPGERFPTGRALAEAVERSLGQGGPSRGAPVAEPTRVERPSGAAPHQDYTRVETPVAAAAGEPPRARTITSDVYISYAPRDKETAETVCRALEARQLSCWMAPRDVLPGQSFAQALGRAIHSARVFVLVFSSGTNESQQVERELDMAVSAGVPILPLRVEAVRPRESIEYYLAGHHWLDAFTPPLGAHLDRLAQAVTHLLEQTTPPEGTVGPEPAVGATTLEPEARAPLAEAATPVPQATPVPHVAPVPEPTVLEPEPVEGEPGPAEPASESHPAASGLVPPLVATQAGQEPPAEAAVESTAPPALELSSQPDVAEPELAEAEAQALEPTAPTPVPGAQPEAPAPSFGATTVEPAAVFTEPSVELEPAPVEPEIEAGPEPEPEPEAPAAFAAPSALAAFEAARQPEPPPAETAPAMTTVEAQPEPVVAAPSVSATTVETAAPVAAGEPRVTAEPPAAAPPMEAEGQPEATFRKRALILAAVVGVAWVAVLVLIDTFVR